MALSKIPIFTTKFARVAPILRNQIHRDLHQQKNDDRDLLSERFFREPRIFWSMDSLKSTSKFSSTLLSSQVLTRAFSTDLKPASRVSVSSSNPDKESEKDPKGVRKLSKLTDLNDEELIRMDTYSKFNPTSTTISHLLDHQDGGGFEEVSFEFLRNEIPVRIANIMRELEVSFL